MFANLQPTREITCPEKHSLIQTDDLCQLYEGQAYTENVYFCDTCRNEYNSKSNPASHCKTCGFDLCPNCYEAQKLIQIDCPQNQDHPLLKVRALQAFSNYASNSYGCHSCGGTFDSSIFPSAHCRACGYDLCPDCFGHIQLHILNPQQSQINFQPPHQVSIEQSQPQPQPQMVSHAPQQEEEQPKRWINSIFTRLIGCPSGHLLQKETGLNQIGCFPSAAILTNQSFFCRTCNTKNLFTGKEKYHCKTCRFDMCQNCYENQKELQKIRCPKSHPLMRVRAMKEFANYSSNNYGCDACGANLDATLNPAAHCFACNYDLCPNCVASANPNSQQNQQNLIRPGGLFINVTCPARHSLSLVNNLIQLYPGVQGDYAKNVYFCDTCRLSFNCQTDNTHHCKTCGFDLCPYCFNKDKKINFSCSAGHPLFIVSNLKAFHESTNAYNENRYACNSCRGSFDAAFDPSCHCKPCGLDLCPKCFETRNSQGQGQGQQNSNQLAQPRTGLWSLFPQQQAPLQKPEESKSNQIAPEKKGLSEEILCVLCLNEKRSYLFNPCSHLCACERCAIDIVNKRSECPICRNPIQSFTKVYMS